MKRILTVFGTRPEAIKMAPLVHALAVDDRFESKICVTAQHREMLDQVLDLFELKPDFDLNIMRPDQSLNDVTTSILTGMKLVLEEYKPDVVLVHGDTATTFAASLSAYYEQIRLAMLKRGLEREIFILHGLKKPIENSPVSSLVIILPRLQVLKRIC